MATTTTAKTKTKARKKYDGPTGEEKLVMELVELMQRGVSPWKKDWGGTASFRNLITGHQYQGANPAVLHMYMQAREFSLPLFCGAGQAKKAGFSFRKGSKACYILRPQQCTAEAKDSDGNPIKDENGDTVKKTWIAYKGTAVFNVADLVAKDDKTQAKLDELILKAQGLNPEELPEKERNQAARDQLSKWVVQPSHGGSRAFYRASTDSIQMPDYKQFHTEAGYLSTLAHEMVHSTGHGSRLARGLGGNAFGSDDYAKEELIAELGAFLIGTRLEIGSNVENHASYLSSWIKCLKAEPKYLLKALSEANKAANLIAPVTTTTYESEEA